MAAEVEFSRMFIPWVARESRKGKRARIPHGPATVIGEPSTRNHWHHDAGKGVGVFEPSVRRPAWGVVPGTLRGLERKGSIGNRKNPSRYLRNHPGSTQKTSR